MLLATAANFVQSFATKLSTALEIQPCSANVHHRLSIYSQYCDCHLSSWTAQLNVPCNHNQFWLQSHRCYKVDQPQIVYKHIHGGTSIHTRIPHFVFMGHLFGGHRTTACT